MDEPKGEGFASDGDLVIGIRRGDAAALGVLYRRHVHAIYRFVLAQVRSVPDAEDLTADTFARMIDGLASFRGEASFKNWLYQIARNAVRNHRRSAGYRLNVPLAASALAFEPPETQDQRAAQQRADAVLSVLRPLPPRYRQILELRFLEGVSIREAAQRMGVSEANAKVLQYRALRKAAAMRAAQEVHSDHEPS